MGEKNKNIFSQKNCSFIANMVSIPAFIITLIAFIVAAWQLKETIAQNATQHELLGIVESQRDIQSTMVKIFEIQVEPGSRPVEIATLKSAVETLESDKLRLQGELGITPIFVTPNPLQYGNNSVFSPTPSLTHTSLPTSSPSPTNTPPPTNTPTSTITPIPTFTLTSTITPTPTYSTVTGIIFSDNFNAGISSQWQLLGEHLQVVDGKLSNIGSQDAWIALDFTRVLNYSITYEFEDAGDRLVVAFCFTSIQEYLGFRFGRYVNAGWEINTSEINTFVDSEVHERPENGRIEVIVDGNKTTVTINGILFGTYINENYLPGRVALLIDNGAQIDNFVITALP